MALTELQEQKYQVIQQRLGEAERAKSRVDWATWTPRLAGAAVFAALAVTVLLVPFRELKPLSVIGKALLVLGGTALYGVYLMRFRPELLRERRKQMFFGASVLLTMGVVHTVAVAGAAHAQEFLSASLAAGTVTTDTVTPAFVFGLLLLSGIAYAVVFDQRFAFDALMINSCAAGLVLLAADAFQPVRLVVAALGSLTAVLFTRNLRSRYRLALVGVVGGVAVAVQLAALYLLGARRLWLVETGTSPLELLLWMAGALVIGAAVGVFSTFLLPVFERVFNITTDLRLIELLEGDHP